MKANSICLNCPQLSKGIFAGLSEAERIDSVCIMDLAVYEKRLPVFREGESANLIYLAKTGLVKVYKNSRHKRSQILDIVGPGEILGIESLFRSQYSSSSEPIIRSELCYCQAQQFNDLLERKPSISIRLIDMMHRDIMRTRSFLCNMGTKKAFARVASCLLFFREKHTADRGCTTFQLPVMRHEMSELLGVSPETISRQLKKMVAEGIIKLENKRVTINNLVELRNLSEYE